MTTSLKQLKHLERLNKNKIGSRHTEETKVKMRKPHNVSDEGRASLKKAGKVASEKATNVFKKGHTINVGRPRSDIVREKQRIFMTGKKYVLGKHWKVADTSKYKGNTHGFKKGHTMHRRKKQTKEHIENARVGREVWRKTKEYVEYVNRQREAVRTRNINHPSKKFSNTKIERKIAVELTKRNITFRQNIGIKNIKNVDFFLTDYNTVIECDGCYWHACQPCGFTKYYQDALACDAQNTTLLKNNGFDVYRFWEHEINKSAEECINKIKKLCVYQQI